MPIEPTPDQQALGCAAAAAGFVQSIHNNAERQTEDAREIRKLVRSLMDLHARARAAQLDAEQRARAAEESERKMRQQRDDAKQQKENVGHYFGNALSIAVPLLQSLAVDNEEVVEPLARIEAILEEKRAGDR